MPTVVAQVVGRVKRGYMTREQVGEVYEPANRDGRKAAYDADGGGGGGGGGGGSRQREQSQSAKSRKSVHSLSQVAPQRQVITPLEEGPRSDYPRANFVDVPKSNSFPRPNFEAFYMYIFFTSMPKGAG